MKNLKILLSILFIFCLASKVNGQTTFTQTFIDKCSGEIKIATTTYVNGNAVVSFYNQIKVFTPAEVQSGALQMWLQATYTAYSTMGCPTNVVVQQTVQQTVNQAVQQAASQAASSAASSAASQAASSAASSTTSTVVSPTVENKSSEPTPAENKSSSETKSESKSEEKKEESKSESKKEEKKGEKKEEKKKVQNINPLLLASDLTTSQGVDGEWSVILSNGISRSSMAGDESYSLSSMIWSNLKQFALNGGYTKMNFADGELKSINSYSVTGAYLAGNYMGLVGATIIIPHPKFGTYGYNVGIVNLFIGSEYSMSTSGVIFWTKPYQLSKKLTLSPQIFTMSPNGSWNTTTGQFSISKDVGLLVGTSFDYKISKRFGLSINYKINTSTASGAPILSNFLIGSRLML